MSWSLYRWVWCLESPLYIGMPPAEALNRCRLYVPARPLWGALTAEIACRRATGNGPQYKDVGEELKQDVRFTYLYPAEKVGNGWCAWLPRYNRDKGLVWQREDQSDTDFLTDRQMRMRLLSTQPSTAIDHSSETAAEGSLRENEVINTRWRSDEGSAGSQVAMVGYVFLRYGISLKDDLNAITIIIAGGDTRYGFGRLKRIDGPMPASDCFGIEADGTHDKPLLRHPPFALAHVYPDDDPIEWGAREYLLGWDAGSLHPLASEMPCWVPGSRTRSGVNFSIEESGLWKAM